MPLRKRTVVVHDDISDYSDKENEIMEEEEDIVKEEETDLREGGEQDDATRQMPSILKNVDCARC